MILYPAIDLKDGRCVRLLHGDLNKETVFNNAPADQAAQGIFGGTIRLSVGIESTSHTAARLTAGLAAVAG